MRRIETAETREKRRQRNTTVITIIMLGLLVLSSVGYAFLSGGGPQEDSEAQGNGQATLTIDGQTLYFAFFPEEVQGVEIETNKTIYSFLGKEVYVVSENPGIYNEIASTLGRTTGRMQKACLGVCEENLPERDCNSTLIVWKESLENKVYDVDNCVFIDGDLKTVDAFLYRMFGKI